MIVTQHLFPTLDQKLIELLRSLTPDEWNAQTVAKLWKVKDVAAHLLDGNIRMISIERDHHLAPPDCAINSYQDLLDFLNELNASFVNVFKRCSPALLIELLETTGKQYSQQIALMDPQVQATFAVSWAGEDVSVNWFHIAREYTEKFHHQQQIRDAVGKPGLFDKELFYPFIDTLLCGLPHTFREIEATEGTAVAITISTDAGGNWYLVKGAKKWTLTKLAPAKIDASVEIEPDDAWKIFTKAMLPNVAENKVKMTGEKRLATNVLRLIAVMA